MAEGDASGLDALNLDVEPIDHRRLTVRQNYNSLTDAVELNKAANDIEDSGGIFRRELPFDEVRIRLAINDDIFVELVLLQYFDESAKLRRRKAAACASEFLGTGLGFSSHMVLLVEVGFADSETLLFRAGACFAGSPTSKSGLTDSRRFEK